MGIAPVYILPVRTRDNYLCIDTAFFNALNEAHICFTWDFKNKGLKFENRADFEQAMRLKDQIENSIQQEVVLKSEKKAISKKGRLF